jgi:Uma2 family endonuclease
MGVMTVPDVWSGQDRVLTVEDMENMPDDEFRYELDDGVLIVSPAPSRLHQLAVTRLAVILSAACPAELVVLAGVGVNVTRFQHRVPDVAQDELHEIAEVAGDLRLRRVVTFPAKNRYHS